MKNPYTILGVNQDADKAEIMKAKMFAMKKKEFPLQEIAVAEKQQIFILFLIGLKKICRRHTNKTAMN